MSTFGNRDHDDDQERDAANGRRIIRMNIPGLVAAKHAIVTDECRRNRGGREAVGVALERLRCESTQLLIDWPRDVGVKFHFILAVERPDNIWAGTALDRSKQSPAENVGGDAPSVMADPGKDHDGQCRQRPLGKRIEELEGELDAARAMARWLASQLEDAREAALWLASNTPGTPVPEWVDAVVNGKSALAPPADTPPQTPWVSVAERLPPCDGRWPVVRGEGGDCLEFWSGQFVDDGKRADPYPTHWLPMDELPPPPGKPEAQPPTPSASASGNYRG